MTTRTLLAIAIIFGSAAACFAQNPNYDRCEVAAMELRTKKQHSLGVFETVIGEEELTTRAFPLPGTKLFIVSSVFYTDESMASEEGQDSMSLELTLSHTRKRDVLQSLNFANAEMPAAAPVGRVTMLVKENGKRQLVIMECRRHVRR
jgi:hypothetical protein